MAKETGRKGPRYKVSFIGGGEVQNKIRAMPEDEKRKMERKVEAIERHGHYMRTGEFLYPKGAKINLPENTFYKIQRELGLAKDYFNDSVKNGFEMMDCYITSFFFL